MAYGCHEERYPLPIQAVDTHRPKPKRGHKLLDGEVPASRAPLSRDYFGEAHTQVQPDDVSSALQSDMDAGLLTPKAATTGSGR